jgi:hypothetical protein
LKPVSLRVAEVVIVDSSQSFGVAGAALLREILLVRRRFRNRREARVHLRYGKNFLSPG